jgi:hypothetical protein
MEFYDSEEKKRITEACQSDEIEELGTIAKIPGAPSKVITINLLRLVFRDFKKRDVKKVGIIMEPERVEAMNRLYGFTFRQLGPTEYYQGGDCAPHIMDLEEVDKSMRRSRPLQYLWFVKAPLRSRA